MVDAVFMVGAVDKVDLVGVGVVMEEVEAGVETTFKSNLQQIIAKTPKNEANKLTNTLETVAAAASNVNGYFPDISHPLLLLLQILLFLLLTQGSNKLLNI